MKERKGKSSAPIADRHLVDGSLQDWWYLRFFRVDWRVHFLPFSIPFLFLLISTINWLCKEWERQRERERERERERRQEKSGKGVGRKRLARRFQNYHFRLTDLISGSVSTTNFNDAVTWQLSVLIWFGILWHSIDILLRFHKAIGIHSHKWHIKILRNSLWGFLRIPERVFEMLMGVH